MGSVMIMILCKCPRCEQKHMVKHLRKPVVMPRLACDDCKQYFKGGNAGGYGERGLFSGRPRRRQD